MSLSSWGRNSWSGGIQQANGDRQPLHLPEDADEVTLLHGQDLGQGPLAPLHVLGEDHLPHRGDPIRLEEHVLGAAEADPLGAELAGHPRIVGGVGIGSHLQLAEAVHPLHQGAEVPGKLRRNCRHLAEHHLAGGAVQGDDIPLLDHLPLGGGELAPGVIDLDVAAAGNAALAHAPCDHRRVGGHAAAGREDPLGRVHAVDVLGARLDPDQDHLEPQAGGSLGLVRGEDHLAAGRSGGGGKALGDDPFLGLGIKGRMEELVELGRRHPQHSGLLVDEPFPHHVHGDLDGRLGGPLAVAGLEHEQLALLDGELDVLHVLVVLLKDAADLDELLVALGQHVFHGREGGVLAVGPIDGLRGPDAGHHVLALGVHQVLAVEIVFAGGGVAGKGNAGGAVVPHVAVNHGLDVDRGAPVGGNVIEPAVGDGPLVHPGAEHGAHGAPELLLRIFGELLADGLADLCLELADQFLPVGRGEVRVQVDPLLILLLLEEVFEQVLVHAHDHIGVHLHEAAIGIVGEALVPALGDDPLDRLIVESQVQDGIHHTRHGSPGAGTDRHQKRVVPVAEGAPHERFHLLQVFGNLGRQARRIAPVVGVVVGADLGGDGESRRDREPDRCHLRQVGPLAPQQILHLGLSFGLAIAEEVNILASHCTPP